MIDRSIVEKVARLARLELSDERLNKLVGELGSILEHVDQLKELDVSDVPPLTHATGGHDVYREDEPARSLSAEEALRNAPEQHEDHFRVPRVIGDRD